MVTSADADVRMPKDKPPLPEATVQKLRDWIDAGLPWEAGFTFAVRTYEPPLRPRRPELPPAVDGRTNPIDRVLDAYLKEHGVTQPEVLDDAAFLRRVYLDLVGLLPTRQRLQSFVADSNPAKRDQLIDELLARRQCLCRALAYRSGTTYCATITRVPDTSTAAASRSAVGCIVRCNRTCRSTSSCAS